MLGRSRFVGVVVALIAVASIVSGSLSSGLSAQAVDVPVGEVVEGGPKSADRSRQVIAAQQALAAADSLAVAETLAAAGAAEDSGGYQSVAPIRVVDTRETKQRIKAGETLVLQIAGKHGVPASGVGAVAYNLTAVGPAGPGFVTAHPADQERPLASSVNFVQHQVVANGVITKLGAAGRIALYSMTDVDVIVDVTGWFSSSAGFSAVDPVRALDTRTNGTRLVAGSSLKLPVLGRFGIPASGVGAVAYNLTAVNPAGPGYMTAFPAGDERPLASNVNYEAGQNVANGVITKLGAGGALEVYSMTDVDVIVDVTGWFTADGEYQALTPVRALDSRESKQRIAAGTSLSLPVLGRFGVPSSGVVAVAYNLTAVAPAGPGFMTAYPAGQDLPLASNVNYTEGANVANNVISKVGAGGALEVYSMTDVDVIVDITGWFAEPKPVGPGAGVIESSFTTPAGVPGTVHIQPEQATDETGDPVAVLTKSEDGTSGVDSATVVAGKYRVIAQPVVVDGVSYEATVSPSVVTVDRDGRVRVSVSYARAVGVQKIVATAIEPGRADVQWETEASTVVVRRVEGRVAPVGPSEGVAVEAGSTSFSDTTVKPGTVYSYRVFAVVDGKPVDVLARTGELTIETPLEVAAGVSQVRYLERAGSLIPEAPQVDSVSAGEGVFTARLSEPVTAVKAGGVQVGSGVILPDSDELPGGAIGKVVGISQDGHTVIVEPGALTDVFTYFEAKGDDEEFLSSSEAGITVRDFGSSQTMAAASRPACSTSGEAVLDLEALEEKLEWLRRPSIQLDQRKRLFGAVPIYDGVSIDLSVTLRIPFELTAELSAAFACEKKLPPILGTYLVGGVPIAFSADLTGAVSLDAKVTAKVGFEAYVGAQMKVSIGSRNEASVDPNVGVDFTSHSVTGELRGRMTVTGTAALGLGVKTPVFGFASGPELQLTLIDVDLTHAVSDTSPSCTQLNVRHGVKGNAVFEAWIGTGDPNKLEATVAEFETDPVTLDLPSNCSNQGSGSGGATVPPKPKKYEKIVDENWSDQEFLCAIAGDGRADCWEKANNQMVPLPSGARWEKFSFYQFGACGLEHNGSVWCWGYLPKTELYSVPAGADEQQNSFTTKTPVRLAGAWKDFGGDSLCGLREDRNVVCLWSDTPGIRTIPGPWEELVEGTCGIKSDRSLWCWNLSDNDQPQFHTGKEPEQIPGAWRSFTVGGGPLCGQQMDNTLWCWGVDWNRPWPDNLMEAPQRQKGFPVGYATGGGNTCMWYGHGETNCVGNSPDLHTPLTTWPWWKMGDGDNIRLEGRWLGFNRGLNCGTRVDGSRWCYHTGDDDDGRYYRTKLTEVQGDWDDTVASPGYICGIKSSDKQVYCWGPYENGTKSLPESPSGYKEPTKINFPAT